MSVLVIINKTVLVPFSCGSLFNVSLSNISLNAKLKRDGISKALFLGDGIPSQWVLVAILTIRILLQYSP